MRAKIESERESEWKINYGYLIGLGGLALAAASVYYARAEHKRETTPAVPDEPEVPRRTTLDHL